MALISNLKDQDLEVYKLIKDKVLAKYSLYHRQANFNTNRGLIAFVDKTLAKYSSLIINSPANTSLLKKSISNISSIASTENDAFIMAQILYSFISNSEAVMVNGALKSFNYAIEYLSKYSLVGKNTSLALYRLVNRYVDSVEYNDTYTSVVNESLLVASRFKADILFSVLSSVFAYTRKLMVYFYREHANHPRLSNLVYKNSISVFQNQLESLLNIFIDSFYDFFITNFTDLNNFTSDIYLESIDEEVFNNISTNASSMYSNNMYSLEESPEKINNTLISEISSVLNNMIVDTIDFTDFLDGVDDENFSSAKAKLPSELSSILRGE